MICLIYVWIIFDATKSVLKFQNIEFMSTPHLRKLHILDSVIFAKLVLNWWNSWFCTWNSVCMVIAWLITLFSCFHFQLPMWYLNYHDQNLINYLNVTIHRLNHTLPKTCRRKLLNIFCRFPRCSGENIVANFTRQQCDKYLKCARFVPGEVNVDAICIVFPSSAATLISSVIFIVTALIIRGLVLFFFFFKFKFSLKMFYGYMIMDFYRSVR